MDAPRAGPPVDVEPAAFDGFARRTSETIVGFAAAAIANGLTLVLLTRTLGAAGTGVVTLSMAAASVLTYVLSVTFIIANMFHGAREPASRGALLANGLAVSFLAGVPAAALVLLVLESTSVTFGASAYELGTALASVPFSAATRMQHGLIVAAGRWRAFTVVLALPGAVALVLMAAAFAVSSPTVLLGLVAYSVGQVAVFVATLFATGVRPARPSRSVLAASVRYGIRASPGQLIQFFSYRLDLFLVSSLKGPAAAGIYSVAVYLADLLWKLPAAAGTLLFPRVAAHGSAPVEFTVRVARMVVVATIASGAVLAALANWIALPLLGAEFADAIWPLLLLLPGVAAIALASILASDLAARGAPQYLTYAALISLAVTVALAPLLIPRLGAEGAAIGSSVAYTASAVALGIVFARRFRVAPSRLVLMRREDVAFARRRHAEP